ncbi:MAG: Tad domain-containing protein [Anaerolineales bacterium]|nr:Tad domain-containing protein [Anaerolineales bacterium]
MDKQHSKSESGQALILIVLAMVALLGFTALAVDGTMIYSDRRYAQNSSDASSLAGGAAAGQWLIDNDITTYNWSCGAVAGGETAAKQMADDRALENGFDINQYWDLASLESGSPDGKIGVYTECHSGTSANDNYIDVHTWITNDTETAFVHFVYNGVRRNTVEAVVRVRPPQSLAWGYAIVALNTDACTGNFGVGFQGTSDTIVNGGGIFSNGCFKTGGTFYTEVNGAGVKYNHLKNPSDDDMVIITGGGTIEQTTEQVPASSYEVPPIDCSSAEYYGSWPPPDASTGMGPGLYCITGNISINNSDTVIGNAVTIVVIDGKLTINGGASVQLTAPAQGSDPEPAVEGLLWYLPPSNDNAVTINGGADFVSVGTILAPSSSISYEGNATAVLTGQIIGWDVFVSGTGGNGVTFDGGVTAMIPTFLDLFR